MNPMEQTSEIIAFKKRIVAEAPASARNIKGVDTIFYMKEPGNDAKLTGTGTVIYRRGWGMGTGPTRYGGPIAADRKLRAEGYRPYNIWVGNQWQENEQRHANARIERQRQQLVFTETQVPKISKRTTNESYVSSQPPMEYPTMEMPVPQIMGPPSQKRPMQSSQQNNWGAYLQAIPSPSSTLAALNNDMFGRGMSENEFAKYAYGSYSNVSRTAGQLGIPGFGGRKGAAVKKRKSKTKKGGAKDEFNFN